MRPGSGEASLCTLADPLRLHLRQGGHYGEQDVAHQLIVSGEVLFSVGVKVDAVGLEALQVAHRLCHPLTAEAVERPEEHQVELAVGGCCKELGERLAVALALGAALVLDVLDVLDVLGDELVPSAHAPGAQLQKLVLGILPFVVGRGQRGWPDVP